MEQDTIRARRIELVDEAGTQRAVLEAGSQGVTGLIVRPFGGTVSASIGVREDDTPFLQLVGADVVTVFASMTSDGPFVQLVGKNGEAKTLTA